MPRIGLHDHDVKKEPMYCTLMKEICHSGWTKSMGEVTSPDGAPIRPRCHKWVGVFVNDPSLHQIREVFDCNERWGTDLQQQIAQEVYQGAAATEEVRNHVAVGNGAAKVIQSFFMQLSKAMGHELVLPAEPKPRPAEIENKNGENHA